MTVLKGLDSTVFINDQPLTIDWATATGDEIVKAMKQAVAKMRSQTGYEPTHCNTVFGWFALRPSVRFVKIKKGPGKYKTVAAHFVRGGKN